jgi:hypothetical protein
VATTLKVAVWPAKALVSAGAVTMVGAKAVGGGGAGGGGGGTVVGGGAGTPPSPLPPPQAARPTEPALARQASQSSRRSAIVFIPAHSLDDGWTGALRRAEWPAVRRPTRCTPSIARMY